MAAAFRRLPEWWRWTGYLAAALVLHHNGLDERAAANPSSMAAAVMRVFVI